MATEAGIRFTIASDLGGTATFGHEDAHEAMDTFQDSAKQILKAVGEMTKPYNEVSSYMVKNIKRRFEDNSFTKSPYSKPPTSKRSRYTKQIRKARSADPSGSTLEASGDLKDSIKRLKGPTSTGKEHREVAVLRIGSVGVSYSRDVLDGAPWEVPIRINPKSQKRYIDLDKIRRSGKSNSQFYGKQWTQIKGYPQSTTTVQVPARNFLHMPKNEAKRVEQILQDWIAENISKGGVV